MDKTQTLQDIVDYYDLSLVNNPMGTDQAWPKSYVEKFYGTRLMKFANDEMKILDIGKYNQTCLAMWCYYLENAQILGLDEQAEYAVKVTNDPYHAFNSDGIMKKKILIEQISVSTIHARDLNLIIDRRSLETDRRLDTIKAYANQLQQRHAVVVMENVKDAGVNLMALIAATPPDFTCHFHDFRTHRMVSDNCLYVMRRSDDKLNILRNRIMMLGQLALYFVIERTLWIGVKLSSCLRR